MAQKQLSMQIVLGGKVDNTVGEIGEALINMGYQIDDISRKLIDFGKESLDVYQDFELSMTDAEIALAANFDGTETELKKQMEDLKAFATAYAANTIFHTNDVANAINQMIHGGWDAVSVMENMAAVGHLAELGGMDLSTALTLVLDTTKALRIKGGENIEEFVDMWAYAANTSSGNALQFGEALQMLGSVGLFTENKAELLSLIALMHNYGVKGTQAATMLKTSILRLIAPSQTAGKVLDQLGASAEEINDVRQDDILIGYLDILKNNGFDAYDAEGQLKPMLDVYTSFFSSLQALAGEGKDILKDELTISILSNIFGMRGIIGSTNISRGLEEAKETYDSLMNDNAADYGEWAAQRRMDTLYGDLEILASKYERLQQATGAGLSGQMRDISTNLGVMLDQVSAFAENGNFSAGLDMIDRITGWMAGAAESIGGMSEEAAAGIMGGLGAVAVSGPLALGAGGLMKFVSWAVGTNTGKIMLAGIAIAALAEGISAFNKAAYENQYGNMSLDESALNEYIKGLGETFDTAYKNVTQFRTELNETASEYQGTSEKFASQLLTDTLTQKTWTAEDLKQYQELGKAMVAEIMLGVSQAKDLSQEYFKALLGGDTDKLKNSEEYAYLIGLLEESGEDSAARLTEIGNGLKDALTAVFSEGLTDENVTAIHGYFDALNEEMARAQRESASRQQLIQQKIMFQKAQTMSYSSAMDYLKNTILPEKQTRLDMLNEEYLYNYAAAELAHEERLAKLSGAAEIQQENESWAALSETLRSALEDARAEIELSYVHAQDQLFKNLYTTTENGNSQSAYLEYFNALMNMESATAIDSWYLEIPNEGKAYINQSIEALKILYDFERVLRDVPTELADNPYSDYVAFYRLMSMNEKEMEQYSWHGKREETLALRQSIEKEEAIVSSEEARLVGLQEAAAHALEKLDQATKMGNVANQEVYRNQYNQKTQEAAETEARLSEARQLLAQLQAELDALEANITFPDVDSAAEEAAGQIGGILSPQEVEATFPDAAANARAARQSMEAYFSTPIVQRIITQFGNWLGLEGKAEGGRADKPVVFAEAGTPEWFIPERHTPETARLILQSAQASGFTFLELAEAAGAEMYAEGGATEERKPQFSHETGGRETKLSIFAEAGTPEWFIPERHTPETARLILQSAQASGFTFLELAEAAGADMYAEGGTTGDNDLGGSTASIWADMTPAGSASSGSSGSSGGSADDSGGIVVQYSPVIHADNADGVDAVLRADKERLKRMLEDLLAERELYESVVTYQ